MLLPSLLSGRPCKSLSGSPSETTMPSFLNLDKHSLTLSLKYISRGSATRPAYDKYTDPEPFLFPHVKHFYLWLYDCPVIHYFDGPKELNLIHA